MAPLWIGNWVVNKKCQCNGGNGKLKCGEWRLSFVCHYLLLPIIIIIIQRGGRGFWCRLIHSHINYSQFGTHQLALQATIRRLDNNGIMPLKCKTIVFVLQVVASYKILTEPKNAFCCVINSDLVRISSVKLF